MRVSPDIDETTKQLPLVNYRNTRMMLYKQSLNARDESKFQQVDYAGSGTDGGVD
jgi:hypothetical protein